MKQIFLWLLSAGLFALSVYYAAFSNFNLGNLLVWILTGMLLAYTVFWRKMDPWLVHTVPGRAVLGVLGVVSLAVLLMIGVIVSGQTKNTAKGDEKVLVVLGCAVHGETPSLVLTYRLRAALEYYEANPEVTIIVCGGKGSEENISEALAMQRWLVAHGVPESVILMEDQSTSTEENFRFANRILTEKGFDVTGPIAFVTNGFHCYRSAQYAAREGFSQARAVPAALPWSQYLTCYLRESFALGYYLLCK